MKKLTVKIIDAIGIHARPASKITTVATKFKSDIKFLLNGKVANAKSLINLMALGAKSNSKITIEVKGVDEAEAIEAIETVMSSSKLI